MLVKSELMISDQLGIVSNQKEIDEHETNLDLLIDQPFDQPIESNNGLALLLEELNDMENDLFNLQKDLDTLEPNLI
jgi:hypothetical protein